MALTDTLELSEFVKLIELEVVPELVRTPVVEVTEPPDTVTEETVLLKVPIAKVPPVCKYEPKLYTALFIPKAKVPA